jgi:hypothetical protein
MAYCFATMTAFTVASSNLTAVIAASDDRNVSKPNVCREIFGKPTKLRIVNQLRVFV